MGYSVDEGVVRADRFKPSGKWYELTQKETRQPQG
jgi:hypothetical protein